METGLKNRTVIITGASRNIGKLTALMLAQEGANLALCTRTHIAELEAVAEEAKSYGVKTLAAPCDVGDAAAVNDFVAQAVETFGRIDVMINNAVYRGETDFLTQTDEQWENNLAVNLTGPRNFCRAVLPHMMEHQWGRIINYSGISPYLGHGAAKAMAKLGIVGFTRGIASEYGAYNITANCIGPGTIDVERDSWQKDKPLRPGQPIRRLGKQEEIASLAVYLASENAGYITGQCYLANGGEYFS